MYKNKSFVCDDPAVQDVFIHPRSLKNMRKQRDPLTGFLNVSNFHQACRNFDHDHPDQNMDALYLDIDRFHLVNERYSSAFGDTVLLSLSTALRKEFEDSLLCREQADRFLIYCPHKEDYETIAERIESKLPGNRISLRIGIYPDAKNEKDQNKRFELARQAAATARHKNRKTAFYDRTLHEKQLYLQRLIEDFNDALEEEQFVVLYQPKFNITSDRPVLTSAEALVRWDHPKLGMISPADFIPLFEENGMIRKLDRYVWKKAAQQIVRWKKEKKISVSISVNVSKADLKDPNLEKNLKELIDETKISPSELLLEITESSYSDDPEITEKTKRLHSMGFLIGMDDFGTGYSTLNLICQIPLDALKIDMKFVKEAFRKKKKDTGMIAIILDIARYLKVLTVAEGVEKEEQMQTLKQMGCDIIQGYYFSKPVTASEFERFLEEKLESLAEESMTK